MHLNNASIGYRGSWHPHTKVAYKLPQLGIGYRLAFRCKQMLQADILSQAYAAGASVQHHSSTFVWRGKKGRGNCEGNGAFPTQSRKHVGSKSCGSLALNRKTSVLPWRTDVYIAMQMRLLS
eukprot:1159111-Pelagomonas_calceolata.AAC.5